MTPVATALTVICWAPVLALLCLFAPPAVVIGAALALAALCWCGCAVTGQRGRR